MNQRVDVLTRVTGGEEGVDQRFADFVVVRPGTRTNRRDQVRRVGPELPLHRLDGGLGNARAGAAPAGVNRGRRAANRIDQQDRDAVRDHHRQREAGLIRHDRVAVRPLLTRAFGQCPLS